MNLIESLLFIKGNKEDWRKQSVDKPMPIFYSLRSITELFNGKYFTIDDVDVRAIGEKLLEALQVRIEYFIRKLKE